MKIFDAVFRVKVTENTKFLLFAWAICSEAFTVCHQTWFGDASSQAGVSCKSKLGCYLQGQGHSEGLYIRKMTVSTVSSELMTLLQSKFSLMIDLSYTKISSENIGFQWSRSRSHRT